MNDLSEKGTESGPDKPIHVHVLGTGNGYQETESTCYLIYVPSSDEYILFDCGPGTLQRLLELKVPLDKLSTIIISHGHMDHYAGLESLLYFIHFNKLTSSLYIYHPYFVTNIFKTLKENNIQSNERNVWANTGSCIHFVEITKPGVVGIDLHYAQDFFFLPHVINPNGKILWNMGLRLQDKDRNLTIGFTGDWCFPGKANEEGCQDAFEKFQSYYFDYLFSDCELNETPSNVHPHFVDLMNNDMGREGVFFNHTNIHIPAVADIVSEIYKLRPDTRKDLFCRKGDIFTFVDSDNYTIQNSCGRIISFTKPCKEGSKYENS